MGEDRRADTDKGREDRTLRERHREADRRARENWQNWEKGRSLSEIDKVIMDWQDPDQKALDEMEREAREAFGPEVRKEMGKEFGQDTHKWWVEKRRNEEIRKGRVENRDFGVNVTMYHPDGRPVYLDYVDYEKDRIEDLKPRAIGETEEELKSRYEEQRKRHIEAYEHTTGRKVTEYLYPQYPSSKDIFAGDENK